MRFAAIALGLALAACAPDSSDSSRESDGRANVVLIMIDTLRADKLGSYGGPEGVSPELDELAREGVVFDNVYAQCSWTRPSIGSLLTGLYPRSLGLFKEDGDALPEASLTLAEHLSSHGYSTFGITANPNINSLYRFDQGFDTYVDSNVVWMGMPAEPDQKTLEYLVTPLPSAPEMYGSCLEWARGRVGRPAYIQVNLMEVHEHDRQLRTEFIELYAQEPSGGYLSAIRQVSKDTGDFLKSLRALPGWEDTLVIVTSDHGEALDGDHSSIRAMRHGDLLYEAQLAVPLILHRPGALEPMRIDARVRLLDLLPTLADLLELPLIEPVHGVSLLGLLHGEAPPDGLPAVFVAETSWRNRDKMAALGPRWKLIESRDGQGGTAPRELQRAGGGEDGALTNQLEAHTPTAATLSRHLKIWRERNPRATPTEPRSVLSEAEARQLEAIGYGGGR